MSFYLKWIVASFYILASASVCVVSMIPNLRLVLFPYGKTLSDRTGWAIILVPKSWFSHFYMLGWVLTCLFIRNQFLTGIVPYMSIIFWLHTLRRLIECVLISKTSPSSRMHITHYLVGLLFYICTSLVFYWADQAARHQTSWNFVRFIGLLIFAFASTEQFMAHSYLASLRSSKSQTYPFPTQRYFKLVACPHYTFELIIYLAFALISQYWMSLLIVLWVFLDLHFAANLQFEWYRSKYPERLSPDWGRWLPGIY